MRATVTVEGRLASLTDRALGRREVAELEGAMGAPLDRTARSKPWRRSLSRPRPRS